MANLCIYRSIKKQKYNKNVLLASLDTIRPAAKEQLRILSEQVDVGILPETDNETPVQLAKRSITKEMIRKSEILKYKELNLKNAQIGNILNNIIQNLNFSDLYQLENYLNNFNISIDDIKEKIAIENEWKNLIYARYSKSIKINKNDLKDKIEKMKKEEFSLEYNLSEIVFNKEQNISLEEYTKKILESIEINGFENTANLYSIADSSKAGGKIGWVKKNNLSLEINRQLENLKINSYSNIIKIGNNYLILKINDMKEVAIKFDKQKELDRMIVSETSKQLEKFSNIFYNKIKLNSTVSEF
mgnify:CR=1 FL=1